MIETERNSYPFEFLGGEKNAYTFETKEGHLYLITFKPTPYLFEHNPEFAKDTFEFSIVLSENTTSKMIALDVATSITIAEIVNDFYTNYNGFITIYICVSSDGKQHVRNRKFNSWFNYFKGTEYIKIDEALKDSEGGSFPVSLIIKSSNPYRTKIFDAFTTMVEGLNHDK
jgi:Family of unknown function (DUF6169)